MDSKNTNRWAVALAMVISVSGTACGDDLIVDEPARSTPNVGAAGAGGADMAAAGMGAAAMAGVETEVATSVTCPESCDAIPGSSVCFCSVLADAPGAQAHCQGGGMNLVSIEDQAKNDVVGAFFELQVDVGDAIDDVIWIGLGDSTAEGTHAWADGTALGAYNNWGSGQPNNSGPTMDEDCAVIRVVGAGTHPWFDFPCDLASNGGDEAITQIPFLCE